MKISDIITVDRVATRVDPASKKRILQTLAQMLASGHDDFDAREAFDCLYEREALGTTGIGKGVALPHGRHRHAEGTVGAFIKLTDGLDFDAVDDMPVDLLFGLLVPVEANQEHLDVLGQLAEMFRDVAFRQRLRAEEDPAVIHRLLVEQSEGG
ncbi:MAG: PTS sugar transporter subunit IIA [Gammaproteobacteria bacterium]|nr:PTS sugar transporter subunit IIA [Gammaproteobacteria bacterium]